MRKEALPLGFLVLWLTASPVRGGDWGPLGCPTPFAGRAPVSFAPAPANVVYGGPPSTLSTPVWPGAPAAKRATPASPKPTARAQVADEAPPRRAPVSIPSPEKLGVQSRAVQPPADQPEVDWTATRRRLRELGVLTFQLDHPTEGGCHFTCLLPTGEPGRSHRIDARGATEMEAVRLVLARAEEWKAERR